MARETDKHEASPRAGATDLAVKLAVLLVASLIVSAVIFRGVVPLLASDRTAAGPPPAGTASRTGPESDVTTQPVPVPHTRLSAVPQTPWRTLSRDSVLTRIGVGSCLHQGQPQPVWEGVMRRAPQLFLMIGDNVYGDIRSADGSELAQAYRTQLEHPEFAAARAALPMLGIWDDHDYGGNDAGSDFAHKQQGERLFREFWQRPAGAAGEGVHYAEAFGPPGRRVQIIFLDTRSFRSPLMRAAGTLPFWGRYEPDPAPEKTMLGAAQWAWLEAQLKVPAQIRLIVSSVQVLAEGHGFERWGNLPAERDRLLGLLERTDARGVVLLSGDRHNAALYQARLVGGRLLPEMTASSLNSAKGPSRDEAGPERRGEAYWRENFGEIGIDWEARRLSLDIRDVTGAPARQWEIPFAELGADEASFR